MKDSLEKRIKILEVDQWTSTGNIINFNFKTFDLLKVKGGDSEAARKIFGGHARILEVSQLDKPHISYVWFIEENNKFKLYKANYDTSD